MKKTLFILSLSCGLLTTANAFAAPCDNLQYGSVCTTDSGESGYCEYDYTDEPINSATNNTATNNASNNGANNGSAGNNAGGPTEYTCIPEQCAGLSEGDACTLEDGSAGECTWYGGSNNGATNNGTNNGTSTPEPVYCDEIYVDPCEGKAVGAVCTEFGVEGVCIEETYLTNSASNNASNNSPTNNDAGNNGTSGDTETYVYCGIPEPCDGLIAGDTCTDYNGEQGTCATWDDFNNFASNNGASNNGSSGNSANGASNSATNNASNNGTNNNSSSSDELFCDVDYVDECETLELGDSCYTDYGDRGLCVEESGPTNAAPGNNSANNANAATNSGNSGTNSATNNGTNSDSNSGTNSDPDSGTYRYCEPFDANNNPTGNHSPGGNNNDGNNGNANGSPGGNNNTGNNAQSGNSSQGNNGSPGNNGTGNNGTGNNSAGNNSANNASGPGDMNNGDGGDDGDTPENCATTGPAAPAAPAGGLLALALGLLVGVRRRRS